MTPTEATAVIADVDATSSEVGAVVEAPVARERMAEKTAVKGSFRVQRDRPED